MHAQAVEVAGSTLPRALAAAMDAAIARGGATQRSRAAAASDFSRKSASTVSPASCSRRRGTGEAARLLRYGRPAPSVGDAVSRPRMRGCRSARHDRLRQRVAPVLWDAAGVEGDLVGAPLSGATRHGSTRRSGFAVVVPRRLGYARGRGARQRDLPSATASLRIRRGQTGKPDVARRAVARARAAPALRRARRRCAGDATPSHRERQCLAMAANGPTSGDIGGKLGIAERHGELPHAQRAAKDATRQSPRGDREGARARRPAAGSDRLGPAQRVAR